MHANNRKVHVILLAGGTGTRFGAAIPKQFVCVNGVPIAYALSYGNEGCDKHGKYF